MSLTKQTIWEKIELPTDLTNLPKGEIIAFDKAGEHIVGYLHEDGSMCESEGEALLNPTHYLVMRERYIFTEEELWNFINNTMQEKANLDVEDGRSKVSYTPAFQVSAYLGRITR